MKNKILPITISILLIGLLLLPLTVLAKGVSPTATVVPASLQPTSPSIVTALKGEDINPQDVEQLTPTTFYDLKTGNHFALLPAELSGNNASANQSDGNDPSTTFYPDAYPESTCMDGFIELGGDYDTWNDIVTSGSGMADSDDTTSSGQIIYIAAAGSSDHWDADIRDYYLFDTSSLGSNVTVTSATLGIYTYTKYDFLGITPSLNVYSANPDSNVTLSAASTYDNWTHTGTTPYAADVVWSNIASNGYTTFTLNSTGISAINTTGISKFCVKNNYDATDTEPTWSSGAYTMVDTYFAEHGTDKPYLLVNYTTGGTTTTTTTTGTTTTSAPGSFSVTTLGSDAHNIIAGQLNGLGAGTTTVHFNWGYSSTDLEYSTPLFQKI